MDEIIKKNGVLIEHLSIISITPVMHAVRKIYNMKCAIKIYTKI